MPEGFITEEKLRKLLPLIEKIVSRKYGKELKLKNLTVGGITVERKDIKGID